MRKTDPSYAKMEASWARQARWGLDDALSALGDHPMAAAINASWAAMTPAAPDTTALKYLSPADLAAKPVFPVGRFEIGFDPATGAIAHLHDLVTGVVWTDFDGPAAGYLAALNYITYNQNNYTDFLLKYNYGASAGLYAGLWCCASVGASGLCCNSASAVVVLFIPLTMSLCVLFPCHSLRSLDWLHLRGLGRLRQGWH